MPGGQILIYLADLMLLQELLVILSGYTSSLDPQKFKHPIERQIFERALDFGDLVASISASLIEETGPVTGVVQETLAQYFQKIIELETRIAELSYSKVIAETVDEWQRPLEYCGELLMAQKYTGVKMAIKLRQDLFSGFPVIASIATRSLTAVDRYYIRQISPWLLWGNMPMIELEYPEMPAVSALVKSIGNFLCNVGFVQADTEFIEVTRESHEALEKIQYPLVSAQVEAILGEIQTNINTIMLPHVLSQSHLNILMTILRNIVLCGSPLFCMSFVDTGSLGTAISQYYENTDEIDAPSYQTALDTLSIVDSPEPVEPWAFGDVLTGKNKEAEVKLSSRFQIFINSTHCDVYGEIFYYLLSCWVTNDELAGYSPQVQHHKLVLNTLWEWFRRNIDNALAELEDLFAGKSGPLDTILETHTVILKRLGKQLLLGSHELRSSVKRILKSAKQVVSGNGGDENALEELKASLESQPDFGDLYSQLQMLRPI